MKRDNDALRDYFNKLESVFNSLKDTVDSFNEANKKIYSSSVWNSMTRDYYQSNYKEILNNSSILKSKLRNVSNHVNDVIENYEIMERNLENLF